MYTKLVCLFVFLALQPFSLYFPQPRSGVYLPHSRDFLITHNDAPQSVGLLWTSDHTKLVALSASRLLTAGFHERGIS